LLGVVSHGQPLAFHNPDMLHLAHNGERDGSGCFVVIGDFAGDRGVGLGVNVYRQRKGYENS
jgi:hypothetical protein